MNPTGIFSLDYTNTVWYYNLPPDKRNPKWLTWGSVVMVAKQWFHNAFFGSYRLGSTDAAYNASSGGYTIGTRIRYLIQAASAYYGDNSVYESIAAVPTNTPPVGSNIVPDIAPSWVVDTTTALKWLKTGNGGNPYYWVKVQDNFIGAVERANYSANRIIFEYALNKWFNCTFRQPGSGNSDIYITTDFINFSLFAMGPNNSFGGMYPYSSPVRQGMYPSNIAAAYDFTIHVKTSVYNGLLGGGSQNTQTDAIIRAFADKINAAGMLYNIVLY